MPDPDSNVRYPYFYVPQRGYYVVCGSDGKAVAICSCEDDAITVRTLQANYELEQELSQRRGT